jgi:hypothetical protein
MASRDDVRRIALSLPETVEGEDHFAFSVLNRGKPLLAAGEEKFFTEPHYNGFPAVLVRLAAIETDELEELITDAWCCLAPRALVDDFDERGTTGGDLDG